MFTRRNFYIKAAAMRLDILFSDTDIIVQIQDKNIIVVSDRDREVTKVHAYDAYVGYSLGL
jgi:hypothetical protein